MTTQTQPTETAVFLGMENRILARRSETDGSLSIVEITVPPGVGAPPHSNQREAITWYVLDGALTFDRGDETTTRGPGEPIYMPANAPHTFRNQGDHDARALMICTPGGFEGFLVDVAAVLPDEAPDGPPPPEGIEAMQTIGAEYGLVLHLEPSSG